MTEKSKYNEDTVAVWKLPLADGIHEIEFEHGTATGKRIIRLDGKVRQFSFSYNNILLRLVIRILTMKSHR